jgi:protein-L-isoaspartate O-methyltransferase
MLTVRREDFIPSCYRDHAYEEIPLPLPGERTAISCPHSYPLFYEPLGLREGDRFLEVGVGSGYGTSLAREVVGPEGLVVAIDIDATTFAFARENLESLGGSDSFWSSEQARARRQRRRPLVNGAAVAPPASPGGRCLCSAVVRETGRLVLSRAWALGFGSVEPSVAAEQVEAVGGGRARRLGH